MEQLLTSKKKRGETGLSGGSCLSALSIGKVKAELATEDTLDFMSPKKIHTDSLDSTSVNFWAHSTTTTNSPGQYAYAWSEGSSCRQPSPHELMSMERQPSFSSWEGKGKDILQDSSEMKMNKGTFTTLQDRSGMKIPPWLVNEKAQLMGYEAMKQCLQILNGRSKASLQPYAECLDCLIYCSLFPKGDIEGDQLLQLWMAAGLIEKEPMDHTAFGYLAALHEYWGSFFTLLREDAATGRKWYKVSKQLLTSQITVVRVDSPDDSIHAMSAKTQPFHATFMYLSSNLDPLCNFSRMTTLLLLRGHALSHIDRVPYEFFIKLELLQVLDLSGTKVSELPSSIGHAKCLSYLDLSHTLINRLPETIDCLPELQTLKLRNCSRLVALPKSMSKVSSLRHLDLGTLCSLRSMPTGMGALTRLRTLSNYVVSEGYGCSIGELKNISNLMGRVCLSRLENVWSVEESKAANLHSKRDITKLDLRWSEDTDWENTENDGHGKEEIAEHLLPSIMLQDLRMLCYGGFKLPSWIGKPSFYKLKSITLFKCENCQLLPSLGRLPSLESLTLIEFIQLKVIDSCFCVDNATDGDNIVAFPKLLKLEIKSLPGLEEWREMGEISYFPCLNKLVLKDCPQLMSLCRLSTINCLEYLEINSCGKLPSLPEGGLPASMKTLVIDVCPLLSLSCSTSLEETQDWHKMEDTSKLLIYQRIQDK